MKRTPILLCTAGVVAALAVLTSEAWAQNRSNAQGGQSPRFETDITVPGTIFQAKRPGVLLVSFSTPVGLPGVRQPGVQEGGQDVGCRVCGRHWG